MWIKKEQLNMKKDKIFGTLYLITAVCFFIAHFIHKRGDALLFILGCLWLCLSAGRYGEVFRKKKEEKEK